MGGTQEYNQDDVVDNVILRVKTPEILTMLINNLGLTQSPIKSYEVIEVLISLGKEIATRTDGNVDVTKLHEIITTYGNMQAVSGLMQLASDVTIELLSIVTVNGLLDKVVYVTDVNRTSLTLAAYTFKVEDRIPPVETLLE